MIRVNAVITITPDTLPDATVGMMYSEQLTASGGTAPYTWIVTVGVLPTGMILNPVTGIISGIPTVQGDFNFTVRATDLLLSFGEKAYD